ncbi:MAG: esterase [Deltaproteobacteria bacterium]|nr:esterase [Deltaproteobacteria bacterium]
MARTSSVPRHPKTPLLLALASVALAGCECERRSLDVGGQPRSFLLHKPDPAPAGPAPLVLALHGRLSTGDGMRRITGYNALADRDGAAVAYPDGIDRSWADARNASPASQQGIDDVAFLLALIEAAAEEIALDRERLYVLGISNGGFMAQTLACREGSRLAGVASIISAIPAALAGNCAPDRPLSSLFMNGTDDPLVPFAGGTVNGDAGGEVLSSDASAAHWVAHDRCDPTPEVTTRDDEDDGTLVRRQSYRGCDGDSAVDYYVVEGGGHTWPGGSQYLPEGQIGVASEELDGLGAVWDFLLAQRRQPPRG